MAPYVLDLPRTGTRVVDLVDVDSEKWRAFADDGKRRRCASSIGANGGRSPELEQRIARECDLSVLVSDAEAELFARQNPDSAARIRGVSNGVDYRYFDPALDHPPVYDTTRPNYVFTGTMDYPPNVDAVIWFATEILPLIRRTVPAAQFHIVGSNPVPEVLQAGALRRRLRHRPGARRAALHRHATASVAPMRIARGIQNKVLEAMAMARPVVLTSGALEGIDADPVTETILCRHRRSLRRRLLPHGDHERR